MEIDRDSVYRSLYRRFGHADPEGIDDAVSLSHIAAWQAREGGQAVYNVDAFCTVVARRVMLRSLEWQKRHIYPDREEKMTWQGLADVEGVLLEEDNHESRLDADHIIAAVPQQFTEVLRLFYLEGKSLEEISRILGLSPECVRKRHERALKWARRHFREGAE